MSDPVVVHLMTQDGQPYSSERRCCEICGLMIFHNPDLPRYTNDRTQFKELPKKGTTGVPLVACNGELPR